MRLFLLRSKWTALALALVCGVARAGVPTFEEVKSRLVQSDALLYDRNGELINEQRTDLHQRQLGWVPLAQISPALKNAVVQSEDQRFFKHHGVDWLAAATAAEQRVFGKSTRGASTLSMQVAAILDQRLKPRKLKRDWAQKFSQIYGAFELEKVWTKDQILEAYLNLISFRGELRGIASASHGLFGKTPDGLNQEEAWVLAALIRSPEASQKQVITRACILANEAMPHGSCAQIEALVGKQGLSPQPFPPPVALAPQVARVLAQKNISRSTLDRRLQARVVEILRRQVLSFRDRNMKDAAALVVDNATGQVLAYVGNIGALSSASSVDGVKAHRQAGSTLKPFLYGLALESGYLTASSKIDDSSDNISLGTGAVYRPQDFDHEYHGDDVTLRLALASSLNIPAVRTLQLIGVGHFVERMKALGFEGLQSEEYYGPSLALGTADVSLWDLVNAYRTLANQGVWSELSLSAVSSSLPRRRVISSDAAHIVADILSDKTSRSLTFGLDSPMALPFWTAAKTGTSKDMRDNWCLGFSERYTVGVWAGNFSGEPMWNVSGVTGAAPAWSEIMEFLHQSGRDSAPRAPRSLVHVKDEWYIRGTEPNSVLMESNSRPRYQAKITYPVEGLVIARDPDIPADRQRVFFEASARDAGLKWMLGAQELGKVSDRVSWAPTTAGDYDLKLVSLSGKTVDQVHFVVRR